MPSKAQNYFNALLALSGNAASADARKGLLANIQHQDLVEVVTLGLTTGIPRAGLLEVAVKLLDELARAQKPTTNTAGPHTTGSASRREHAQGTSSGPEQGMITQAGARSQNASTANVVALNISSPRNKRPPQQPERSSPPKRLKATTIEPEDNERKIGVEFSSEEEEASDMSEDTDDKKHADGKGIKINDSNKWQICQQQSVMIDLGLQRSDSDNDEDYTEDLADTELSGSSTIKVYTCTTVPNIKVVLYHAGGFVWKNFSDLSTSMVRSLVQKFNTDFLMQTRDRKAYQALVRRRGYKASFCYDICVRKYLISGVQTTANANGGTDMACDDCVVNHRLCARIRRLHGGVQLAIYPLPARYRNNATWREIAYWVRE